MKKIVAAIGFVLIASIAVSQIRNLRYNDDFGYLSSDTVKKGFEKLKYIRVAKQVSLSFGGEVREQLQWYQNINFGDVPPAYPRSGTWQLWHRAMAHTNIDIGRKTRVFMQLNSTSRFLNSNPLTPEIEEDQLGLHQAFIDYRLRNHWLVRIGRQEMAYGSHRLITFREGPNNRLSFDALVFKFSSARRKVDAFMISPVISQRAVFDDQSFKDLAAGIYVTERLTKKLSIDYYMMHFHSKRRQYNFVSGVEDREIVGFRLFSEGPELNYELEGTYQFGKFNRRLITAFGVSADFNYKILPAKDIIMGLAGNYLTGDRAKDDDRLNTYNLLYSKPQYGLAAPVGATNMITVNPYLKISPLRKTGIYLGANLMWRQSNQDGTYSPGGLEVRPGPEYLYTSSEKHLGTLFVLETSYSINSNLSVAFDGSKFFAGSYVKQTGKGKDITYVSFKAAFKF